MKKAIENALTSGQDVVSVVRQIFEGIALSRVKWMVCSLLHVCLPNLVSFTDCQSERTEPCRRTAFVSCVDLLNSDRLQSQVAKELVGKLLIEVQHVGFVIFCKGYIRWLCIMYLHTLYICD